MDITGQKFNKLTVLSAAKSKRKNGWHETRVLCRCDCGIEKEFNKSNVLRGKSKSCGCFRKELITKIKSKRPYESKYNRLLDMAKRYERECHISYEDFIKFTSIVNCHYCEAPIIWKAHSNKYERRDSGYYLDRKNSSKGYSIDNCVVCCCRCNKGKLDHFTYEEWLKIGEVIKTFKEDQT